MYRARTVRKQLSGLCLSGAALSLCVIVSDYEFCLLSVPA